MAKSKPKSEELQKSYDFYLVKIEEFNKLTLEELKTYYQTNQKKIGGMHKRALFDVVNTKLQEIKDKTIDEKLAELKTKEEDVVVNVISDSHNDDSSKQGTIIE